VKKSKKTKINSYSKGLILLSAMRNCKNEIHLTHYYYGVLQLMSDEGINSLPNSKK